MLKSFKLEEFLIASATPIIPSLLSSLLEILSINYHKDIAHKCYYLIIIWEGSFMREVMVCYCHFLKEFILLIIVRYIS